MDSKCEVKKDAFQTNDHPLAAKKALKYLEELDNAPLTIVITGETGSGKSTLINALRGVDNKDERAASTGVVETTVETREYPHPDNPNIKIWDLPGVGSSMFTADKYLEYVGFEKFDFFIIVCDNRFRENDAKLAQEIQKMNKKFYFVRSKIDDNMRAAKRSQREFSEEKTLTQIRENCVQELQKLGLHSQKVFLISSFELHLYDFEALVETLEEELPQLQRDALLLALPNISLDIIDKKKKVLQAQIKWFAITSALGAVIPVPGLSAPIDIVIIVAFITKCQNSLSLSPESLHRYSHVANIKLEDLKAGLNSRLAGVKITATLVTKVLTTSAVYIAGEIVEEGAKFIPLIGIPIAMGLSFAATYTALKYLLKTMAEDAQRVFTKALGLDTSV